jgi:hypothetical protein
MKYQPLYDECVAKKKRIIPFFLDFLLLYVTVADPRDIFNFVIIIIITRK